MSLTNKDLLSSSGNSIQYSVIAYMGKESLKRANICIHITDSLYCTVEAGEPGGLPSVGWHRGRHDWSDLAAAAAAAAEANTTL